MNEPIIIRPAEIEDASAILAIYDRYVRRTAITFEYETPTEDVFCARMENTMKKYPYLVAQRGEEILGYAYAGVFYGRAAYDWCAEVTVYLAPAAQRLGLGRRIYAELEQELSRMGVLNLYACIAVPHEEDDEYLTKNSMQFHAHMGYALCGRFSLCGYKFGRWYDMVWMQKIIGDHGENQPPVTPYPNTEK